MFVVARPEVQGTNRGWYFFVFAIAAPAQSSASWKNTTEATTAVYHRPIDCLHHELSLVYCCAVARWWPLLFCRMPFQRCGDKWLHLHRFELSSDAYYERKSHLLHNGSVRMSNPSCDALPTDKILLAFYVCVLTDNFSHRQIHVIICLMVRFASICIDGCCFFLPAISPSSLNKVLQSTVKSPVSRSFYETLTVTSDRDPATVLALDVITLL